MICLNIPLVIVGTFLPVTLLVGIFFSRKKTSFQEYAVGNKQFATATLVATVLATVFGGGGLVGTIERVHNTGLYWIIVVISSSLAIGFIVPLAFRMGPFMRHLSLPETTGKVYGKYPRIITAVSSICASIALIAAQIKMMSLAIRLCIDTIDPQLITILATLIVIAYSILGGIRAITFLDVLQFVTFAVIIPLLAYYMMLRISDKPAPEIIFFLQSQEKFQFRSIFRFNTELVAIMALVLSNLMSYVDSPTMQRVYMCSGPIQASKVFLYATFFSFVISIFILLISVFVFVGAPALPMKGIWEYIVVHVPPTFKGFVTVSLLAMSMSTADSCLNSCAVMVSHDILESIRGAKDAPYVHQIRVARITVLVVGLFAMVVAFCNNGLLNLFVLALDLSVPIITAPFILAIFRFRGTSSTALIGMATGLLTILAWNKWVEPPTKVNGSFIAMLTNGLAMMAAHYILKQPAGAGWIEPDTEFIQMQQVQVRKKAARKEMVKNGLIHFKQTLASLVPSHTTIRYIGFYLLISNLLVYFISSITNHDAWLIPQLLVGAAFLGYSTFVAEKRDTIPGWLMVLLWVVGLAFALPINLLWHWWHRTDLLLTLGLSLAHLLVTLLVLPLYLGIAFLMATLFTTIYLSSLYCTKPLFLSPLGVAFLLLLCLGLGLLIFGLFVYFKTQNSRYLDQVTYLKHREKTTTSCQLKASLCNSAMVVAPGQEPKGNGATLPQVIAKMEESVSLLDSNLPLYKQDFQGIFNKIYDRVTYFSKKEKSKNHALLQSVKIGIDQLINKLEYALSQEVADPPKLFLAQIKSAKKLLSSHIVCDIHQIVYLLAKAILRISAKLQNMCTPLITLQLHPTTLRFRKAEPLDESGPSFIDFGATAWVIGQSTMAVELLPKVKEVYADWIDPIAPQAQQGASPSIDVEWDTISSIVTAHYGYLEGSASAILFVLPTDVTAIRDKIKVQLPIDCLVSEAPATLQEQADSLMALMQFHDQLSKYLYKEDPIDRKTISRLLVLLRQHFRFKRHGSGQLFYVRAVGIAGIVAEWVFYSPKVIYASLLYELVRHTCLPLSYIKAHYNLGVYAFVSNVVTIDQHEALDHPSLLYVKNRLKQAIKADHVQLSVLFIKLAERLYDLRQAAGYRHLSEVAHMVEETRTIDIQIANTYLGPEVGAALETAAKEALAICKDTR